MLVKRYEPFNDIRKGFDLVNAIINSVEDQRSETPKEQAIVDYIPNMNIRETAKSYHIEIELPGVSKENTNIQLDGDILTVSGERSVKEEQEEEYRKVESQYGKFSRAFTLPKQVDTGKIEASFKLGILEISIPKKELVDTSKKIQIK